MDDFARRELHRRQRRHGGQLTRPHRGQGAPPLFYTRGFHALQMQKKQHARDRERGNACDCGLVE